MRSDPLELEGLPFSRLRAKVGGLGSGHVALGPGADRDRNHEDANGEAFQDEISGGAEVRGHNRSQYDGEMNWPKKIKVLEIAIVRPRRGSGTTFASRRRMHRTPRPGQALGIPMLALRIVSWSTLPRIRNAGASARVETRSSARCEARALSQMTRSALLRSAMSPDTTSGSSSPDCSIERAVATTR